VCKGKVKKRQDLTLTLLISTDKSKLSRYDKLALKRFLIPDGIVQLSIFLHIPLTSGAKKKEREEKKKKILCILSLSIYRCCVGASISITILAS
jgi:hypothetical protein